MRRQIPVASIIYSHLYPTPGTADPPNFQTHLARDLIPEIRIETATFYGSLDSIEARYPGLNYCHAPHRMRLGRFPHHAKLFQAIDELGITDQEVMDLARWEGTLWARQRFERDEGIRVRDTTGDGIIPWVDARLAKREHEKGIRVKVETAVEVTQDSHADGPHDCVSTSSVQDFIDQVDDMDEDEHVDGHDNGDDEDGGTTLNEPAFTTPTPALGHDFNRRILAALAARDSGLTIDMAPELEAYLKELVESGHLMAASRPADGPVSQSVNPATSMTSGNPTVGQPTA